MQKYNLKRVGVVKLATIVGAIYFIIGLVIFLPIALLMSVMGPMSGADGGAVAGIFGGVMMIFIPVFYAIMGFIGTAIACLIFNFVASRLGGVEMYMETEVGEL